MTEIRQNVIMEIPRLPFDACRETIVAPFKPLSEKAKDDLRFVRGLCGVWGELGEYLSEDQERARTRYDSAYGNVPVSPSQKASSPARP